MHLIFDTETSNFPQPSLTLDHPKQGRIVQLAALLLDEKLEEVACLSTLILPTTWEMSAGAQNQHGITIEQCSDYGVPIETALKMFEAFFDCSECLVAHNIGFDIRMLQMEGFSTMNKSQFCTMTTTTDLCKILHPTRGGNKWPKLSEALKILLNIELTDAHDALADARGCAALYRYLIAEGHLKLLV